MTEILSFDHQSSLLQKYSSLYNPTSLSVKLLITIFMKRKHVDIEEYSKAHSEIDLIKEHTKKVALFMQRRLTIPTKPHKTCKEETEAYTNLHSTLSTKMIKISLKHTFFVSYSWDFLIHWHFSLFFKQKSKDKEESLGTPPSMLLLARPNPLVQRRSTQHCPKHKKLCMLASSYWKKPKFHIELR